MADNLPVELLSEITSHLTDCPTSLDGLQVGFTCKELYKEFRPVISKLYRQRLVDQYENGGIKILAQGRAVEEEHIDLDEFKDNLDLAFDIVESSDNPGTGSAFGFNAKQRPFDFEFWLMYCPSIYDVDDLWSLISLMSRDSVIRNISILVLGILPALTSPDSELRPKSPTVAWGRALMKFFEVHTRRKDSKLIIYWDSLAAPPTSAWDSIRSSDLPVPNYTTGSFLTNVGLSGPIDLPVWDLFLLPIFRQSSSGSTELHISDCHIVSRHVWIAFLNGLWHLPHLSTFEVATSTIPTYMHFNPEQNTNASLTQPWPISGRAEPTTWIRPPPDMPTGHFLPNLRALGGTVNLILLFDEADVRFPKLVELIIQESHRHEPTNFLDLTRVFAYTASHLPHIQTLTLDLPYSTELSDWLEPISSDKPPSPRHAPLAIFLGALRRITTLNFNSPGRQYPCENVGVYSLHPKLVASFMARLPSLKTVVLTGLFNVPLEAVSTEEEFWQGIRGMWDTCHDMEELKIHGIGQRGSQQEVMIWRRDEAEPTPEIESYSQFFNPPVSA